MLSKTEKVKKREKNIKDNQEQLAQMQKESEYEMQIQMLKWENDYLRLYPTAESQKYITKEDFIEFLKLSTVL